MRFTSQYGLFRYTGEYFAKLQSKQQVLLGGVQTVASGEKNIYEDFGTEFKFRNSDGKGLKKESKQLFDTWVVQSGSRVIETMALTNFNKGDLIKINDDNYRIETVDQKIEIEQSNNLTGSFEKEQLIIQVLFIG